MRTRLFCILSLAAAFSSGASAATPEPSGIAVVELFTSEGCSSCPPADRLLADIAAEAEPGGRPVFALSFHVDYWNHLGWADPFSKAEFTERQRRYAEALSGGGGVYTPQMIVNGTHGFVGSKGAAARSAIRAALARASGAKLRIDSADADGQGNVRVTYAASGHGAGTLLNLALVEEDIEVPVGRGENGGRTLKHHNVVRSFRTVRIGTAGGTVKIPLEAGLVPGKLALIAYLQDAESLAITAAARTGKLH